MYTARPGGIQTAFKAGSRYRVLTTFPDDTTELVEEYDAVTLDLICRRWRSTRPFGGPTDWEYEIGDPKPDDAQTSSTAALCASSLNPSFHPRDTRKTWEWHIKNLPFPEETYSLSVDEEKQALVLRTKNKKYFKVFRVATLARAGLALQQSRAKMSHDGCSTLTISYAKPESVIDQERKARASARDSSSQEQHGSGAVRRSQFGKNSGGGGEAPPECKQS